MKRCLKLAVVCFLCAVGFAGSSNAAWPLQTRFDWLRAQLVVTRALDGALWRYFYLRELAKDGRTDAYVLSEIDADFDAVARHGAEVCPGLGRPFALMRDIRDKAHALVGHVPGVETKTDVAKCRRITKALLLGLPGTTADATPAGLRPLI